MGELKYKIILMKKISTSTKVYIGLVVLLAIVSALSIFLPMGELAAMLPQQELPAAKSILALVNALVALVVYGSLGFLGLKLSQKLGWAKIWDERVSHKQRFLIPGLIGLAAGVFLILGDLIFSRFHNLGQLPHPAFPASLNASLAAGIGEEIIFRLFFIAFWTWLISYVIFKKKYQPQIFWLVAILAALIFALGHLPAMMIVFDFQSLSQIPIAFLIEIIVLNSAVALPAAYYFRQYGFLAAVGIHFWADIVWHVVWGVF